MANKIENAWVAARKKMAQLAKKKNFVKMKIDNKDGFTNVKINIENADGDVEISYAGRKMLLQFRNEGTVPSIDIFPCGNDFDEEASFNANIYSDHHLSKPVKADKEGRVPVIRQMILFPNK